MANVESKDLARTPGRHVIPDLSKPDPLVKFTVNDTALVYGSKWKHAAYFKKVGDDYFVTFQRPVGPSRLRSGKPYVAKDDWWVTDYLPDNFQRPTSTLCDGCPFRELQISKDKTVTEMERRFTERCPRPGQRAREAAHARHATS